MKNINKEKLRKKQYYEIVYYKMKRKFQLPFGIFMLNDFMAYGVYQSITKSGLKIPDDISVVGFDDIPQVKYLDPPLTTLRHALLDHSEEIFEALVKQMQTQTCAPASETWFKGRMIIQEPVRRI